MRIRVDRTICIAAGMCVMTADRFFDQDARGIVLPGAEEVPVEEQARVRIAVGLCPSGALQLAGD